MTEPTNSDTGAENTAQIDSITAKISPADPFSWSPLRKPAVWLTLGMLATAGVSSIALARSGGWDDGHDGRRYGNSERYNDDRYDHGGRHGRYERLTTRGRDDGPGDRYRGSDHWMGGFGFFRDFDIRFVERVLAEVNATDEQRTKIRGFIRAARNDIETLHDRIPNTRKAALDLLTNPTVDRTALEALRAERQKFYDELSNRMTQVIADVAEVLTPEQRANLATVIARRGDNRRR